MCATIDPSAARGRRRCCSTIRLRFAPRRAFVQSARRLPGRHAGRRVLRLQRPLRQGPQARADPRSRALGARKARLLRPGETDQDADRRRDRAPHRRAVRHRARRQRSAAGGAARSAPGPIRSPAPPRSRRIYALSTSGCRRRTRSPRRSATSWPAGRRSRASSTTGGFACRATPPNAPCAALRSAAATGLSLAPIRAAVAPQPSSPRSRHANSKTSTRTPGSPTFSPSCPIIPSNGSPT
jgi:hypothetical protein